MFVDTYMSTSVFFKLTVLANLEIVVQASGILYNVQEIRIEVTKVLLARPYL
jgi:hypothetical protein